MKLRPEFALLSILVALVGVQQTRGATPNFQEAEGALPADPLTQRIDFRYAPTDWQTAICLPDDWQKSLVRKDGALLYDYPGRGLVCDTRIRFGIAGEMDWTRQDLTSPRVPIVRTMLRQGDLEITQEAFAVVPAQTPVPSPVRFTIERLGPTDAMRNWANPPAATDPAFAHIALGRNAPIRYRFAAKPEVGYTVAFGLCEGYHSAPGQRPLVLRIEGKVVQEVDLVGEKGQNQPAVYLFPARDLDGDGYVSLSVAAAEQASDKNAILNTLWVFEDPHKPAASELFSGSSKIQPLARLNCSESPLLNNPARHDLVIMRLRNGGERTARVIPTVTIESEFPVTAKPGSAEVQIGTRTKLALPEGIVRLEKAGKTTVIYMPERMLRSRNKNDLALGVIRGREDPSSRALDLSQAARLRAKAQRYWEELDLPYGKLTVPDAGIQALVDSSTRNIYQAREIKQGLPAFQVGPTRYRGLWVVDGAFLLEAVTFLGRAEEARNGVNYLMSFQQTNGSFMLIDGHFKETGIAIWTITRHARLTGDKAWLRQVWPRIERGLAYIRQMRDMPPADAPNARLVPAGYSDGGLSGKFPEYTNVYWTLAGVRAAIEAALWLGLDTQAENWQQEYDDFLNTFHRAARRDLCQDPKGHTYLPIRMSSPESVSPQKAQWAFLHAVFPGKIFSPEDPLVQGNMAMLQAAEEQGLVRDTGWVQDGLWTYFGSFYAHAWLWSGDGQKAARTLYAFGNHASPLLVWREEQMPAGKGDQVVGDMPHNWASAEFIRLVRHSLLLEREEELHLLQAMPPAWTKPGAITAAEEIATEFGPVSMECRMAKNGKTATLKLSPPVRTPPRRVVLHLDGWSGRRGVLELSPTEPTTTTIQLSK